MFKKVACFTDIHFGMKGNSRVHNDDCEAFIYWFIEQAKAHGCETCIFLGDWHHHRASTNVSTMNYTVSNMERLGKAFEKVYVIMGNHDLFYREKREINSMEFIRNIPKPIATVEMPDAGGIQTDHFAGCGQVFSGHFHTRQMMKNVTYMGNSFPHNYADAWDDDRGMMIIEMGGKPKFINWPDMPRYITIKVSQLLEDPEKYLKPKMYVRVTLDIKISYEEAIFVRETFIDKYNLRELQLIPEQVDNAQQPTVEVQKFDSVDQIVIKQLQGVDSETYDKHILTAIYNDLDVTS